MYHVYYESLPCCILQKKAIAWLLVRSRAIAYIYNNVYLLQHYPTCEPGLTFPSTDVTLRVPSKFTADRIIP